MNFSKIILFIFTSLLIASNASAQNVVALKREINAIKEDVEVLQRSMYRGAEKGKENSGDVVVKLGEMEELFSISTGKIEEMEHKVKILEEKLDMINKDIDVRFAMLEGRDFSNKTTEEPVVKKEDKAIVDNNGGKSSAKVPTPATKPVSVHGPVEDVYKKGLNFVQENKNDEAISIFNKILTENPNHALAANAQYWLGEAYYAKKDFERAAVTFAKGYEKYRNSPKASDCLLKLGMTMVTLGKKTEACAAFKSIPVEFPNALESVKNKAKSEMKRNSCG